MIGDRRNMKRLPGTMRKDLFSKLDYNRNNGGGL